jgi:hypothetical protein
MHKRKDDPDGTPAHLGAEGREFYSDMVEEFGIVDASGIALLTRAAECLDRIKQAQNAIRKHGAVMVVNDKLVANPAVRIEKEGRDGFYAAIRLLHLEIPKAVGRPPRPIGASLATIEAVRQGRGRWPRGVA